MTPTFVPEYVKFTCNYGSKTKKATVTFLVSYDAVKVTFNGVEVEPSRVSGKYKYTYSEKNVEAGKIFEIVAYNSAGEFSETYTVVAE